METAANEGHAIHSPTTEGRMSEGEACDAGAFMVPHHRRRGVLPAVLAGHRYAEGGAVKAHAVGIRL
jgi:hypothetical protein